MHSRYHTIPLRVLLVGSIFCSLTAYQQAVIIQPVIDVIGFSFCKDYNIKNSLAHYQHIPICAKSGRDGCVRLHQLLYNEQVTIVEAYQDEVRIEVSNLFFQTAKDDTQHIGYWTHKRNVMPLSALKKKGIDLTTLPKPISFLGRNTPNQEIVTLVKPYHDPITNQTFSAGTRFVRAHATWQHKTHVHVYALLPQTLEQVIIGLPKKDILMHVPITPHEQQQLFVSILKKWAHQENGYIPYVWGGCSLTQECTSPTFALRTRKTPHGTSEYYHWLEHQGQPYTGFDCAGLIARAAQLAGMPYYFKNTTTIARNLESLSPGQEIEPGDLIWFSGHVLIVADTTNHTAIEARGYDHGFGKIQEIPLKKLFEGITSYQELIHAYFGKKPLKRLNIHGDMVQTIPTFKLLKMSSIWHNGH